MKFESETAKVVAAFSLSDCHLAFLRDVDVFLDYLVKNPVSLSKSKNQPPVKWTQSLNCLLKSPEELTLNRPMTSHYGQVMGLFLLVRSSGLGEIRAGNKGNQELHISEALYQQWQSMSDIERYFSLLESWVNCGHATFIGERVSGLDDRFLPGFLMLFGEKNLWQKKAENDPGFWLKRGKLFNLAILAMTGLAECHLEDNNRQVRFLKLTPWGQLILKSCQRGFIDSLNSEEYEAGFEQVDLLPAIKAVRNDIQRTLEQPEPVIAASYFLSVGLGSECFRTLKVSADKSLDELAEAILEAFDFENDHLFHFQYKTDFGACRRIGHPYGYDFDSFTDETELRHLNPSSGMKIMFVFDYGDNWEFDIVVLYGSEETASEIVVTERKGEAPEQYPDYEDAY